jgi:hypothetical protein
LGKTRRGHKERSKEQELKFEGKELRNVIRDLEGQVRELTKENTRLRRQAAGSRKELARMDLDRHAYVREIIEEHLADEQESIDSTKLLEKMKAKWRCHEPSCSGHLEIVIYSKMGVPWYFRQCSECPNRTKAKPHHPGVEGPLKPIPAGPVKLGNPSKIRKER